MRGKVCLSFILIFMLMTTPVYADTMYATTDVNVRAMPSMEGEIIDVLKTGDQVDVLMHVERDRSWNIVNYNGTLRAVCADYLSEEKPEPAMTYYGNCRITFYCPCGKCCPKPNSATASGVMPTAGWTVANGSLPFGTHVMIGGHEYCVEDRGVGSDAFDIFVNDHQEALNRGLYYDEVYVIE